MLCCAMLMLCYATQASTGAFSRAGPGGQLKPGPGAILLHDEAVDMTAKI